MLNLDRSGRQEKVFHVLKFDEPAPSIKNYPTRVGASASSPVVSFSALLAFQAAFFQFSNKAMRFFCEET